MIVMLSDQGIEKLLFATVIPVERARRYPGFFDDVPQGCTLKSFVQKLRRGYLMNPIPRRLFILAHSITSITLLLYLYITLL